MKLNKTFLFFILIAGVLLQCACSSKSAENKEVENVLNATESSFLIRAEPLNQLLLVEKAVSIIDCRTKDLFAISHLPNAVSLYRDEITDTTFDYDGIGVNREVLAAKLSQLGVESNNIIVLYDDRAQCEATRLWWMLMRYGHEKVKILDGGFQEWQALGLALSTDSLEIAAEPTNFVFSKPENNVLLAKVEEVLAAVENNNAKILDCRSKEEFDGDVIKSGAFRAGHIPNAIHYDFWNNVETGEKGEIWFKSEQELREKYQNLGFEADDKIIIYCQSGVRSAQTLFVLHQILGYKNVKNFDGSWIEWSYNADLPIEGKKTENETNLLETPI